MAMPPPALQLTVPGPVVVCEADALAPLPRANATAVLFGKVATAVA